MNLSFYSALLGLVVIGCGDGSSDPSGGSRQSYAFQGQASQRIDSDSLYSTSLQLQSDSPQYTQDGLCTSVICITPSQISGQYFALGLLIQSNGNGMNLYFEKDNWSDIMGNTETMAFDAASPLTYSGPVICCSGEGDLSTPDNSYFSDVAYMFGYLDVTFEIPQALVGSNGPQNNDAVGEHSVRIILADDVITSAKRGDLMIKDEGRYLWMNANTGELTDSRPSSPVTMNEKVVNWTNPFGSDGNQEIPTLWAGLETPSDGPQTVTEDEIKLERTYEFAFNAKGLVIFPDLLHADGMMLTDRKTMFSKFHVQGLPYGNRGEFSLPKTTLSIGESLRTH